ETGFTPGLVQTAQITANPFHLIKAVGLKLSTTEAGKDRIIKTLMGEQRLTVKRNGGSNWNFITQQCFCKLVLFANLIRRPALRTVEFNHKATTVFILELIDTVFIAVKRGETRINPDPLREQRIHDGIRV